MKIKEGDKLPDATVVILEKDHKEISTSKILNKDKVILFGLPGAFTPTCSNKHLPSFLKSAEELKKKDIKKVFCISVNDPFVMEAWGKAHNAGDKILMAGDPFCKFIKDIGADVDKSERGLGIRSSRFTMLVENSIIKEIKEEKDTASCEISAAENFLKEI